MFRKDIDTDFNETETEVCINPLCCDPQTRLCLKDGLFVLVCDTCGTTMIPQKTKEKAMQEHLHTVQEIDSFLKSIDIQGRYKSLMTCSCQPLLNFIESLKDKASSYNPDPQINIGDATALTFLLLLQFANDRKIDIVGGVAALLCDVMKGPYHE